MKKIKGKLRNKLLQVTITPLLLSGVVVMFLTYFVFMGTVQKEVQRGLQNIAIISQRMMDHLYVGDYYLKEQDGYYSIYKGEHNLSGKSSILEEVKQDTGTDISIFYKDVMVLTTLKDADGNSNVGMVAHASVVKDVFQVRKEKFYKKVLVGNVPYFAYYSPIYNGDGTCIGMIFAGKPTQVVNKEIWLAMLPVFIVQILVVTVFCFVCSGFTKEMVRTISGIKSFLREISAGNLKAELDGRIVQRNDELGEMGRFTVHVQKFLREMIEKDILTKLYSRRIGEVRLNQVKAKALETGTVFCIALGDIDHFKRFNDTYGHDCGDLVLKEVATVIAEGMMGKGFAIRWGGEEFLLVYENSSLEEAGVHLADMREKILAHEICYNEEKLKVTITFGIVQGMKEQDIAKSIKLADDLLYTGKNSGRNQIVGLSEEGKV